MRTFFKRSLSVLLAAVLLFGSVAVGGEGVAEWLGALVPKAQAASESDLTFRSNGNGTYYVSGCNLSASGALMIPSTYCGKPVTSIGNRAFEYCTGLTSVTIPDSVTSIGRSAFDGCAGLTSIAIPDSVTSIGFYAFLGCTGLTSVTIPDSVTNIGYEAFGHCTGLTSITIPNSVTSIGSYAFCGCTGLTSITVAAGNTVYDSRNNCNAIIETASNTLITGCKNTTIPNSVKSIGDGAFNSCTGLTSVTIPDSVTSIGDYAFYKCTGLTDVYYTGTQEQWNKITIGSDNKALTGAAIHCNCNEQTETITGIFKDYTLAVMINTGKTYVCDITVDGRKYPVSNSLNVSESEADNLKGKTVIMTLRDGLITEISNDSRTTIDFDETIPGNIHYGTNYHNYETEKHRATTGSISNYANTFYSAMDNYYSQFKSSARNTIGNVDIKRLAKKLKEQDEATSDRYITMQADTPSDSMDSIYYVLSLFLSEVFDDHVDIGDIDFSGDLITADAKVVNAVKSGMAKSGAFEKKYGGYTVTFNTVNMWGAFAGSVTADDGSGHTYTGTITSTYSGTVNVINEYLKEMSDVVKDVHKKALFSIISEFKSVVGISKYTDEELKDFLSDLISSVAKKKLGKNILLTFRNIKYGYRAYAKIANNYNTRELSISDAKAIYNELDNISFSTDGIGDKVLKDALKSVETAKENFKNDLYNYIYGIDPENKTKFGDAVWNLLGFKCPVEFEVYDSEGVLLGYVDSSDRHEEYVWYDDSVYISVDGDAKYLYVPADMEISINFIGIDSGTMNYTVERLENGVGTSRLNYYDVPLTAGCSYTQDISANLNLETVDNAPVITGDETLTADECLSAENQSAHIDVTCACNYGGIVAGAGSYPAGELVKVIATPMDGYDFIGWYLNDELVDSSAVYRFVAKESVALTAKFQKHIELNTYRTIENAENTNGFAELINGDDSSLAIHFSSDIFADDNPTTVLIKLLDADDVVIDEMSVSITVNEDGSFTTDDFVCSADHVIEMYDMSDHLIFKFSAEYREIPLISITVDETEITIGAYSKTVLSCLPNPLNAKLHEVVWSSSDESIATVDAEGNVTAVAEGFAVITATYGELTSSCTVNVTKHIHTWGTPGIIKNPTATQTGLMRRTCVDCNKTEDIVMPCLIPNFPTAVQLDFDKVNLTLGKTATLTATVLPSTAVNKNVTWATSDVSVATVENGIVTPIAPGYAVITVTAVDTSFGIISTTCLIHVLSVESIPGKSVVDNMTNQISGIKPNMSSLNDCFTLSDGCSVEYSNDKIGTGTLISIVYNGEMVDTYTAVVFGDINGDSWYDGTDAYFVYLVANGMISPDALTAAQRAACDTNHDGIINADDAKLIEKAGILLNQINQNAAQEELNANSAYIEYCGVIDQIVEPVEITPDSDPVTNAQPEPQTTVQSILGWFRMVFTIVLNWLLRIF